MTLPDSKNFCIYETSFIKQVQEALPSKKTNIVVFGMDKKHNASKRAGAILTSLGYEHVHVYAEGVEGWKKAGGEIVGTKKFPSNTFKKKSLKVLPKESYIEWEGTNIFNKHTGTTDIASGAFTQDNKNVLMGEITVDMKTVTNKDMSDKASREHLVSHLKSPDFFEVQKYPTAKMQILSVKKISDFKSSLNYQVTSLVTIKSKTLLFTFKAHGHITDGKLVTQGNFILDRSKWDVQYGSSRFFEALGKHLVHDEIRFRFRVVAE
jgi:polyisoprenoid-binding protein YceI